LIPCARLVAPKWSQDEQAKNDSNANSKKENIQRGKNTQRTETTAVGKIRNNKNYEKRSENGHEQLMKRNNK